MKMDPADLNKTAMAPVLQAMRDFEAGAVRDALIGAAAPDAVFRLGHPFEDQVGAAAYFEAAFGPLLAAVPDLERRDFIVMAGPDGAGADWLGCGGSYVGTFAAPWLDIPPTGHLVHMRFHEFYRFEAGKIVEMQAIWDIPEVMMQAGAWPMQPSLGREWAVPGPATQDGIVAGPYDAAAGAASCAHVVEMLAHMIRHPAQGGPEVMELARFWHPKMTWYGGMPDRGQADADLTFHFFGDGPYAAVTGWPNMRQTVNGSGWLGIAPNGRRVDMRSLDFWRMEEGLIRENWVLVDLLHVYAQLGVDVLGRMREFNKARAGFDPQTGAAL